MTLLNWFFLELCTKTIHKCLPMWIILAIVWLIPYNSCYLGQSWARMCLYFPLCSLLLHLKHLATDNTHLKLVWNHILIVPSENWVWITKRYSILFLCYFSQQKQKIMILEYKREMIYPCLKQNWLVMYEIEWRRKYIAACLLVVSVIFTWEGTTH